MGILETLLVQISSSNRLNLCRIWALEIISSPNGCLEIIWWFMHSRARVRKTSQFNGWQPRGRRLKPIEIARKHPDHAPFDLSSYGILCLMGHEFEPLGRKRFSIFLQLCKELSEKYVWLGMLTDREFLKIIVSLIWIVLFSVLTVRIVFLGKYGVG